jgi:hypothetical protein
MNQKAWIWGDVQRNSMMTADVVSQWATGRRVGGGGGRNEGGGDVWTVEYRIRWVVAHIVC